MDRNMLAQLMTQQRPSQNIQQATVNWPAFMAEQMRNIPPLASDRPVPPRMGGQLGQLGDIDQVLREAAMRGGPKHPFAQYIFNMPDQPPYDPTYEWNRQHR
jgi:hypothetical protein